MHEWVVLHTWMSHVKHMNESKSHTWMSHVTHMNESCYTHGWVTVPPHEWVKVTHMNESYYTHEGVTVTHTNVTHTNDSRHTHPRAAGWENWWSRQWGFERVDAGRRRGVLLHRHWPAKPPCAHLSFVCSHPWTCWSQVTSRAITHCNTLQHTATHYNTLQRTAVHCNARSIHRSCAHTPGCVGLKQSRVRSLTATHTATHCNTHCNTLQHTAWHCNTLHGTATHCMALQHTASHVYFSVVCAHTRTRWSQLILRTLTHCNIHYNTL